MKLLIDGDSFLYRAGFAAERTKYLVSWQSTPDVYETFEDAKTAKARANENDDSLIWSRKELEPVENANLMLDLMLRDVKERFNASQSDTVIYLTPSVGNFRDSLAKRAKYKGNRDAQARPTHYKALAGRIVAAHGAIYTEGQEADDAIGIALRTEPGAIVVHIDKDLNQLGGRHYNWVDKSEYSVTAEEGIRYHYQQTLSGDSGDNIPGIDGVGPVGAKKIVDSCKTPRECWQAVIENYTKAYGNDKGMAYALEAAQLTHIRRQPGQIWQPPKK